MPADLMMIIFCVVVKTTDKFCVPVLPRFLRVLKLLEFVVIFWKLQQRSILAWERFSGCLALLCFLPRVVQSRCAWLGSGGQDQHWKEMEPLGSAGLSASMVLLSLSRLKLLAGWILWLSWTPHVICAGLRFSFYVIGCKTPSFSSCWCCWNCNLLLG